MRAGEDRRGMLGRLALADAALEAARGQADAAQGIFKWAIALFRRYQLPWDEAQALESCGTALINAGEPKLGDRRLDAAAALNRRHGAGRQWLQRLARLRARGHHGYAPEPLAAQLDGSRTARSKWSAWSRTGKANQEIAETLVLSVRTVEPHLAHVYDKLGVRGRSAPSARPRFFTAAPPAAVLIPQAHDKSAARACTEMRRAAVLTIAREVRITTTTAPARRSSMASRMPVWRAGDGRQSSNGPGPGIQPVDILVVTRFRQARRTTVPTCGSTRALSDLAFCVSGGNPPKDEVTSYSRRSREHAPSPTHWLTDEFFKARTFH